MQTHAPYYILWPAGFYNILYTLPHKQKYIGKKKVFEHKMCKMILSKLSSET